MPPKAAADDADSVEPIVRKTAAWAWRLLVILTALVALLMVIERLEVIVYLSELISKRSSDDLEVLR